MIYEHINTLQTALYTSVLITILVLVTMRSDSGAWSIFVMIIPCYAMRAMLC